MKDLQNLLQSINNLNERYNLLQQKLKQHLDTYIEHLTEANAEEIGKILDNYRTRKGILNQIKTQELSRITSTKEGKLDNNGAARKFVKPKNIKAGKVTFEDMDGFYKESKLEDGVLEDFRKKTEALEQEIKAQIEQQNKKFNTDEEQSSDKIEGVNKELENKKIVLNELKFKIELFTRNEIQDETLEEAILNCNNKCKEDKKALVLAQGSSVEDAHKIALESTPDLTFFQFLKTFDVGKSEQEVEEKKKKLEKERDAEIKKITEEFVKGKIEETQTILHEMNNDKIFCKAEGYLSELSSYAQPKIDEEAKFLMPTRRVSSAGIKSVPDEEISSEAIHAARDNLHIQKNNQTIQMPQPSNIPHHLTNPVSKLNSLNNLESPIDLRNIPLLNKNANSFNNTPVIHDDVSRKSSFDGTRDPVDLNFAHFDGFLVRKLSNTHTQSDLHSNNMASKDKVASSLNPAFGNLNESVINKAAILEGYIQENKRRDQLDSNKLGMSDEESSEENESIESNYTPTKGKKKTRVTKSSIGQKKSTKKHIVRADHLISVKNYLITLMQIFGVKFAANKDIILILQELADHHSTQEEINTAYLSRNNLDPNKPNKQTLTSWLRKFASVKQTKEHPYKSIIRNVFGEDAYNQNSNEIRWDKIEEAVKQSTSINDFIAEKEVLIDPKILNRLITELNHGMQVASSAKPRVAAANLKDLERVFKTSFSKDEDTIFADINETLLYCPERSISYCIQVFLEQEEAYKQGIDVKALSSKDINIIKKEVKRLTSHFDRFVRNHYPLLRKEFVDEEKLHNTVRNIFSEVMPRREGSNIKRRLWDEVIAETSNDQNENNEPENIYKKYQREVNVFDKVYQANSSINEPISSENTFLKSNKKTNELPRLASSGNSIFSLKNHVQVQNTGAMNVEENDTDVGIRITVEPFK